MFHIRLLCANKTSYSLTYIIMCVCEVAKRGIVLVSSVCVSMQ